MFWVYNFGGNDCGGGVITARGIWLVVIFALQVLTFLKGMVGIAAEALSCKKTHSGKEWIFVIS